MREVPPTGLKIDNYWQEPSVQCSYWCIDSSNREYRVLVYADSSGEALEIGKRFILDYIESHRNPLTTVKEVVEGKADGRTYPEIFYEICRTVLELKNS